MEYIKRLPTYKIVPWHIIYKAGKINNGYNFQYTDNPVVKTILKIKDKLVKKSKTIKEKIKKIDVKQQEPPIKKEVPVESTSQVNKEKKNLNSNYNIRGFVCFPVKNLSTSNT